MGRPMVLNDCNPGKVMRQCLYAAKATITPWQSPQLEFAAALCDAGAG